MAAVAECENLDELTSLTDELEKLLRNSTELLVQFLLLSSKLSSAQLSLSSTMIVMNDATNLLSEEDDSLYEFMSLYDSEDVVDCSHLKDAADTILDELAAANAFPHEEISQAEDEPEQYHRPHLPIIETELELTTEHDERNDATTDLLMKGFLVSDTNLTKRKNKSPRGNGDKSRISPGKGDGEKKRGRPPVSPCDKTSKVKKTKTFKKVVNELSDCDEEFNR